MLLAVWDINLVHFIQLLDPIKTYSFLKIEYANKSIFPIEIRAFYRGQLGVPIFLHYSLNVTDSLEYQFGSP